MAKKPSKSDVVAAKKVLKRAGLTGESRRGKAAKTVKAADTSRGEGRRGSLESTIRTEPGALISNLGTSTNPYSSFPPPSVVLGQAGLRSKFGEGATLKYSRSKGGGLNTDMVEKDGTVTRLVSDEKPGWTTDKARAGRMSRDLSVKKGVPRSKSAAKKRKKGKK